MCSAEIPALEEFLAAPLDAIRDAVPRTVVLAGAGTRREAMLQGIPWDQYADWSMDRLQDVCMLLFRMGVRNLFIPIIRASQAAEGGSYGERLWSMANTTLGSRSRLDAMIEAGIRVRSLGAQQMPQIIETVRAVEQATAHGKGPTIWWMFAATAQAPWNAALEAIVAHGARSLPEAITAVYGEYIDPVDVYIAFGKPFFSAELMPPLLEGQAAAFWYQQPGYLGLSEGLLRRIFYEAAYLRRTWSSDKGARYAQVPAQRAVWERPLVLGLGRRVGSFWYPELESQDYLAE